MIWKCFSRYFRGHLASVFPSITGLLQFWFYPPHLVRVFPRSLTSSFPPSSFYFCSLWHFLVSFFFFLFLIPLSSALPTPAIVILTIITLSWELWTPHKSSWKKDDFSYVLSLWGRFPRAAPSSLDARGHINHTSYWMIVLVFFLIGLVSMLIICERATLVLNILAKVALADQFCYFILQLLIVLSVMAMVLMKIIVFIFISSCWRCFHQLMPM